MELPKTTGQKDALPAPDAVVDGGDLDCGNGLLLIIRKAIDPLQPGQVLEVRSREPSVAVDLPAWCRMVEHAFLGTADGSRYAAYFIEKDGAKQQKTAVESKKDGETGTDVVSTLDEDLEKARNFTWNVRVRSTDKGGSRAYARGHSFDVGQPVDFDFSKPDAPLSAVEYLLASLASCLTSGYKVHASRRGVTVYQAELSLQGRLDNPLVYLGLEEDGHPGFAEMSGTFYVNADGDDDVLQQIWETTVARSPVVATLKGTVELNLRLSIVL